MATIIREFSDIELFEIFNVDPGIALAGQAKHVRHTDRAAAKDMLKRAKKLKGGELWYFNPRVDQRRIVSDKPTPEKDAQKREERIAQLEAFYNNPENQENEKSFWD